MFGSVRSDSTSHRPHGRIEPNRAKAPQTNHIKISRWGFSAYLTATILQPKAMGQAGTAWDGHDGNSENRYVSADFLVLPGTSRDGRF